MIYYTLPGYHLKRDAIALRDKFEGATRLKLHCEVSGDDVNAQITMSTDKTHDVAELRDVIIYYLVLGAVRCNK